MIYKMLQECGLPTGCTSALGATQVNSTHMHRMGEFSSTFFRLLASPARLRHNGSRLSRN